MPVIVIGADTEVGTAVVDALLPEVAELRVFVTDAEAAEGLKSRGTKVAVGDVSDRVHVGDAAHQTFCAVIVAEAALDGRERSFAAEPHEVIAAWAGALSDAGTTRAIWVGGDMAGRDAVESAVAEFAAVPTTGRDANEVAADAAAFEGVDRLP